MEVIHALKRLLQGFEPETVKKAAKIAIDMIYQRLNGNHRGHEKRSFNKNPKKTSPANAYTPRGF